MLASYAAVFSVAPPLANCISLILLTGEQMNQKKENVETFTHVSLTHNFMKIIKLILTIAFIFLNPFVHSFFPFFLIYTVHSFLTSAFLRDKPSQPTHVQVFDKSPLNLTCPEAFGFPAPHVAWIHNGSVLQNTTLLNLHLKSPPVPQDSVIDCVVSNKHGSDFHQFQLQFKSIWLF